MLEGRRMPLDLDTILWLIGLSAEFAAVALCIRAKLFRKTPVFCAYLLWSVLLDLLPYVLAKSPNYLRFYIWQLIVDSIFQFAVLVELGWAVLRPLGSLPKHSILILGVLITIAGAIIWPMSAHMLPAKLIGSGVFFVHAQQTIAVLRIVIFLALAGFSQLLSISWRNRELQIATGLGFFSMCSLAIWIIHAHQVIPGNPYYHILDQVGVGSYICSLIYWIVSFSQQEQERQAFTPEIHSFLLAVTGAARGTRIALADSTIGSPRKTAKP
jgi:hypothetical protein